MKNKWLVFFIFIGCMVFIGMVDEVLTAGIDFPTRPINLYVGWDAGGGTCMQARVLSEKAGEIFKQPVVVIPKPGVGGTIASDFVRKAKPDGYSLTLATISNHSAGLLVSKANYNIDDFEYLGQYCKNISILFVSSESPFKTIEDLIAYAKTHPRELKYASLGSGSSTQIVMEMLNIAAGLEIVHIPMKSSAENIAALLGGHVQVTVGGMSSVAPVKEGGKVRFLALAGEKRIEAFPDVPTFAERGYPTVVYDMWYGVAGPKGIPKEVSNKLKDAFAIAFQDKEVKARLGKLGVFPTYKTGDEFTKMVHSDFARYQEIFKKIGLIK